MTIRPMTANDYEQVHALWLETPGMGLSEHDDSEDGFVRYLKRNPETCFAAEAGGKLIGTLLAGHDGRRGFIYHTAVAVNAQRRGVGSALVAAATDALRREGIVKVALVAYAANTLGNSFWEKEGFEVREDLVYRNKFI